MLANWVAFGNNECNLRDPKSLVHFFGWASHGRYLVYYHDAEESLMTHPAELSSDDIVRVAAEHTGNIDIAKYASKEVIEKVWLWGGEQCDDHGWDSQRLRRQCTYCWGTLKEAFEADTEETPYDLD